MSCIDDAERQTPPANWALSEIGEITLPVAKIDPSGDPERKIAYIDISGIDNQVNRIAETKFFRVADAPSRARQIVSVGDVLFSLVRPYLRNIAQVSDQLDGQIASTGFAVLRPSSGIDPKFLFFKAISREFVDSLSGEQYGVSYPAVKDSQVRAQPVLLPPTNEQRRIVEKIETLFARLDQGEAALRQTQQLLARYRQSVLKAAVTGALTADWRAANAHRLEHGRDLLARILQTRRETWQGRGKYQEPAAPDTTDLPELPEGWVWATVDQVVSVFRNGLSKKPVSDANNFPILRISATRAMSVAIDDLRYYQPSKGEDVDSYWVEKGDLLFTRYNGSAHLVGVCGQMRESSPVLHPDKLIKARPVPAAGLYVDYLETAWNAGETRRHIAANIKTTSGQQGVAGADIKSAPFPLPPAEEQALIAELISDAFERVRRGLDHCQTELTRSAALRQSILKDAFAGKLVPQDPADEPATELLARIRASRASQPRNTRRSSA